VCVCVCLIVLDRVCVCVFVSVSFHPKKNPINLFGHWQASTARWWPSTFGRWWDKKKDRKMKIEIIFYKFWTPKSMLHIRIIIFQKEIKLNVLFIKCYWVHRKKMRCKCVMKLRVHRRIKFNSVVSSNHLMCVTKKNGRERVCHNSYWVALFVQNEEKEEKTYGHTIPLNSSDRSTVEQNRPPSIFYFYFFWNRNLFLLFCHPDPPDLFGVT